jgi:gamma-glutamyltranspeptidase/glutathione hydrolase
MTVKDLNVYEAKWRAPITLNTKTKNHSMSPPSSGGICLSQIMKMIEPLIFQMGHNSVKAIQVITEAERRAFADRNLLR